MRTPILIVTLVLLVQPSPGQTSHHLTTDQGLLTNMLTTVIRDRNNYMWIGSYNGLHKHEGSRIKLFKRIGKDSASISGGEMHGLFEDRKGFIWIGTTAGLDKIDPVTGRILHFTLRSTDNSSSFVGYIYSVFQDKEDFIWASTDAAVYRINYETGEYTTISNTKTSEGMPATVTGYKSGVSTSNGMWMHTAAGMVYYEYSSRKFFHRYHNPRNEPIFNIDITVTPNGANSDMAVDTDSNMYFITNHSHLARYNLRTGKLDSFFFKQPARAWYCCYAVSVDRRGNVWIGFRHGGLLIFNSLTQEFSSVRFENNNSLLSSNYIYSICEDYTGRMWVTTDKGLDIIDLYNESVQKKFLSEEADFTNLMYAAGNLSEDTAGNIYVPFSNGGLMKVNSENTSTTHWRLTDTAVKRVIYIFHDNNEGLLAAANRTIFRLKIINDQLSFSKLNTVYAAALAKTTGDVVWLYKEHDRSVYFKKSNGSIYHYNGTDSLEHIPASGYKQLACISRNRKYLYYINGELNLVRRDLSTRISDVIRLQDKLKTLDFSFANPRDVAEDGQGNIWITSQNGVLRYQTDKGELFAYTTRHGLSHSFTFSICSDSKGRVWVGSLGGVDWYNAGKDRFQNVISYSSGTYMDAFGSCLVTRNDVLFFLAGNILFRIVPDAFLKQQTIPLQLKVNEVMVNGTPVNWQRENLLGSLSYRQNRIQINYSLLDFGYQPNIKYFYYLEGSEKDWIESSRPEVSYNSLPAGRYIFHVKAVNASGEEIQGQINLPIIIRPPFWQTWWFRIVSLMLVGFIIYWLFRRRIRSIKSKAEIRQQMTELESKALRAQMNPHFIFNSLNAIQELIVTKNFTEAYQYLSSFSKLLRMVLNNSEKNFIPLSAEIEMNRHYLELESLRFKQSFYYGLTVQENIDEETTLVPSLLLQPFIENAIWHGLMHKEGEKKLDISFRGEDGYLVCTIEDNGIGREKSEAIKSRKIGAAYFESKGMTLSRQRIETLNQQLKENLEIMVEDLKDAEGLATGTRITITIPKQTTFI